MGWRLRATQYFGMPTGVGDLGCGIGDDDLHAVMATNGASKRLRITMRWMIWDMTHGKAANVP
jgi:hypothetical protein